MIIRRVESAFALGRFRRVTAVVLAGGLVATFTTASGTANADEPVGEGVDIYTVVSGMVTRDGVAAGDVDVVAEVWPNEEVLDGLVDEEQVPTTIAATTVTSTSGWFTLALNPAGLGADYVGPDGQVDIALLVADEEYQIEWSFSAERNLVPEIPSVWGNPRVEPGAVAASLAADKAPTHLTIDIGADAFVLEDGNHPAEWEDENGEPLGFEAGLEEARVEREPRTVPDGEFTPALGCLGWGATSNTQKGRSERYVRSTGLIYAPITVRQETSAKHTLGIALKLAGSGGSWSQSGTITRSVSASATTNYGGTSSFVYNRVNYRQYKKKCYYSTAPNIRYSYQWRPYGFHSLNTKKDYTSRPNSWNKAANCEDYSTGTYTKRHGRNATYSKGVDLDGAINVSANATFENSNAVELSWTFSRRGGWLCGSNDDGWTHAPQAAAFVIP